jgi:hypothetical protein
MLWVSRQAGIPIHQRDLRVGSLSEFAAFRQSSHTRPTRAQKTPSNLNGFRQSFCAWAMRRAPNRSGGSQSLTTLPTRLRLATTLRMRALQVKSPKMWCVCFLISTIGWVFIGLWGRSTNLEKSVWHHVVAGRPGGVASTNFLHHHGLLLLV